MEVGVALQYHLTDLREYTEYTFWVSAYNENGEGAFSEEIACRTYSDTPADPPQNVTIESASSSSIIGEFKNTCHMHRECVHLRRKSALFWLDRHKNNFL